MTLSNKTPSPTFSEICSNFRIIVPWIYYTGVITVSIAKICWNRQEPDLIRASGIWMKPKGQVSKFTCTNTVTSSRTLVKSHKVFQKDPPKAVLEKNWSGKFHEKFTQNRLLWSSFFSYLTTCNFTEKTPITVVFEWLLKRFFRILFYVRTLVKQQKELKYSSAYVLGKSWFEEFHKIHPK